MLRSVIPVFMVPVLHPFLDLAQTCTKMRFIGNPMRVRKSTK